MACDPNDEGARFSERGVTTAEALVAGMILGLGLLAVTQVLIGSTRASAAADDRTVAARIATSQVGELRSLDYDGLGVDAADPEAVAAFGGSTTAGLARGPGRGTVPAPVVDPSSGAEAAGSAESEARPR